MRVRFRLNQLLTRQGIVGHGRISQISEATGIERHKLSKLLDDAEDKISLAALSELCRFLISRGVDPHELPGALFEIEPSRFLALLRRTSTLRTCFGVRQRRRDSSLPWAAGADSYLHGKMLELVLRPEPAHFAPPAVRTESAKPARWITYPEIQHFHQEQVHAATGPLPVDPEECARELALLHEDAARVDQILHDPPPGKTGARPDGLVQHVALMLGSVKSNPVCEIATARVFGGVPWQPHGRRRDDEARSRGAVPLARTPQDRAVPFFLRYRDDPGLGIKDAHIPSCYAGVKLCQQTVRCGDNSRIPGIYYETEGGEWECAPWNDVEDAAIVLLDHDRLLNNVELVMGGFSSRATLMLGDHLEQIVDHLLPATFDTPSRAVGAYVIRFSIPDGTERAAGKPPRHPHSERPPVVIPVARSALERRLLR